MSRHSAPHFPPYQVAESGVKRRNSTPGYASTPELCNQWKSKPQTVGSRALRLASIELYGRREVGERLTVNAMLVGSILYLKEIVILIFTGNWVREYYTAKCGNFFTL